MEYKQNNCFEDKNLCKHKNYFKVHYIDEDEPMWCHKTDNKKYVDYDTCKVADAKEVV